VSIFENSQFSGDPKIARNGRDCCSERVLERDHQVPKTKASQALTERIFLSAEAERESRTDRDREVQ
jgi:hypothetical protein